MVNDRIIILERRLIMETITALINSFVDFVKTIVQYFQDLIDSIRHGNDTM